MQTRPVKPLTIIPQSTDKKPKEGRGITTTAPGTVAELPALTPSVTPVLAGGAGCLGAISPGTIPPPGTNGPGTIPPPDNDKPLSDGTELKKAGPSMSAIKGKPTLPAPFKKNTPEKPVPLLKPTKLVSNTPQGALGAPVITNGEMLVPLLRNNGELPPGGAVNGVQVGGRNGEPGIEGLDDTQEGVDESEYSLLADAVGESSDFSKLLTSSVLYDLSALEVTILIPALYTTSCSI